jgi:hypothetical protein
MTPLLCFTFTLLGLGSGLLLGRKLAHWQLAPAPQRTYCGSVQL